MNKDKVIDADCFDGDFGSDCCGGGEAVFCLNATEEAMPQIADKILKASLVVEARLVVMIGDLGAGKTHLAREIVASLTGDDVVPSPTFSIVNSYEVGDIGLGGLVSYFNEVNHFDLYRINGVDELESLGFLDMIGGKSFNIIEWPEIAMPMLAGLGRIVCVCIKPVDIDGIECRQITCKIL